MAKRFGYRGSSRRMGKIESQQATDRGSVRQSKRIKRLGEKSLSRVQMQTKDGGKTWEFPASFKGDNPFKIISGSCEIVGEDKPA